MSSCQRCEGLLLHIDQLSDQVAKLSDPAYRLVKVEDLEKALWMAYAAGSDCGMHSAAITKQAMQPARTLVGWDKEEQR